MAWPALLLFRIIDGVMATKQIRAIRSRVERHGARKEDPERPEDGSRHQFQAYEVIYASGARGGRAGVEHADQQREAAIRDGVLRGADRESTPG